MKRKGITAAAFMASLSTAGRDFAPAAPLVKRVVVERWDGQQWIEKQLEWNGTEYREVV